MKQGSLVLLIAVWCVGSALMLTGCGGEDEGAPSSGPAVGTWTLTDDRGTTVILSLAQSGDRVAGTVVGNAAQAALRSSSANGVVSGEVDGNSISLVIVYDDGHTGMALSVRFHKYAEVFPGSAGRVALPFPQGVVLGRARRLCRAGE